MTHLTKALFDKEMKRNYEPPRERNSFMLKRNVKLVASGIYLPKRRVSSQEIDEKIGKPVGTVENASGVRFRYFADPIAECSGWMGARAAEQALEKAKMNFKDLDAVICASGTPQQILPSTASFILKEMNELNAGIPAFDVSSTCVSFITGLDVASSLIAAGRFNRILIVSTEAGTVGIDYTHVESAGLFGDGACAWIVEMDSVGTSEILSSDLATYPSGADLCRVEGGGTKYHATRWHKDEDLHRHLFKMDGRKSFRMATETVPILIDKLLREATLVQGRTQQSLNLPLSLPLSLKDMKIIIPHQASGSAMALIQRRLNIPDEKWMNIIQDHGNMIAASIPLALHYAVEEKRLERGDLTLLVGTAAGFAVGGLVLRY